MTPLHLAAIGGHDDVCARLLDLGARADMKDQRGRTALGYATKFKRDAVRRRLLAAVTKSGASSLSSTRRSKVAPEPASLRYAAATDDDAVHDLTAEARGTDR